jgi:5-methylcytosine-specific restriction endonuclease McrA
MTEFENNHFSADRGVPRSGHWETVRKNHIAKEPRCQFCGGYEKLEVHHMEPFHLHPEKELLDENLITLCEQPGIECHLRHGHLGNWKNFNPKIRMECDSMQRLRVSRTIETAA